MRDFKKRSEARLRVFERFCVLHQRQDGDQGGDGGDAAGQVAGDDVRVGDGEACSQVGTY